MTPEEKAISLIETFKPIIRMKMGQNVDKKAKECALVSVDEILNEYVTKGTMADFVDYQISYWQEVKQEIENL